MNYENFKPNFNKPTVLTAKQYDTKVSYELENSDTTVDELMVGMLTLLNGLGYSQSTINEWIKQTASNIYDEEHEVLKEALSEWHAEDDECTECGKDETDYSEFKDEVQSALKKGLNEYAKDEDYEGQFKDWETETPIEEEWDEEVAERRMNIIGQNGNEGTHYSYEWDDNIKGYDYESNSILSNINDSITIIKDKMEDLDMRMDNIDEQLDILNADVANIEYSIENPIKEKLINALANYKNDVVDMETGEVTNEGEFDDYGMRVSKMNAIPKQLGKWQTDNKTKKVLTMDKTKVKKGKIKDLKK